ncbi:MAG: DNA recombination protein RmuC [Hydrogenovibrio sp.]
MIEWYPWMKTVSVESLWGALAGVSVLLVLVFLWNRQLRRQRNVAWDKLPGLVVLQEEVQGLKLQNQGLQSELYEMQVLKGELEQRREQAQRLRDDFEQLQVAHFDLQQRLASAQAELAARHSRAEAERESHAEKLALLENAKQTLMQEFKVLSNEILEQKQQQMRQQSQETIGGLIQPVQTALTEFKQRIEAVHKEDLEGRASLTEQLRHLTALNQSMTQEAQNLTKALKGDRKMQGNWGELILRKLLESSGLREGIEFETEKSVTETDGQRYRPDVVVNLPDNKHVIIDSKVSLSDYEAALNAEDEAVRQTHLKGHTNSLSRHIQSLSEKRYDHLSALNAPDFVLMFIPVEGAYLMAIEQKPSIFETAFEKRVAVVTPTTLFTTLKTIEQLWRYERQSEHTVKLIQRAADVHDKFVGFVETFEKVGKQLSTVQSSYDQARKQMMSGSGNLVRQAEMLKTLAGKTKKDIPKHLLEEAEGASLLSDEEMRLSTQSPEKKANG